MTLIEWQNAHSKLSADIKNAAPMADDDPKADALIDRADILYDALCVESGGTLTTDIDDETFDRLVDLTGDAKNAVNELIDQFYT